MAGRKTVAELKSLEARLGSRARRSIDPTAIRWPGRTGAGLVGRTRKKPARNMNSLLVSPRDFFMMQLAMNARSSPWRK